MRKKVKTKKSKKTIDSEYNKTIKKSGKRMEIKLAA